MNTHRTSTVPFALAAVLLVGLATLSACSDTTARSAAAVPSDNAVATSGIANPLSTNVVDPSGTPAATGPTATSPVVAQQPTTPPTAQPTTPPTAPPTTTAPTTPPTTPPTTAPTTTTPPTNPPPSPMFLTRGPMVLRLSDSCYSAVWPIRVWGTVENLTPLDPSAAPVLHEFDFILQPQNPLDVIDGGGYVRGFEGDTQMVINIHVAHFTDPKEIETPISTFNATDVYSSFPLGAVDVLPPAHTCFLTLTHYQTWVGQI